jgi:hypothetical protein
MMLHNNYFPYSTQKCSDFKIHILIFGLWILVMTYLILTYYKLFSFPLQVASSPCNSQKMILSNKIIVRYSSLNTKTIKTHSYFTAQ